MKPLKCYKILFFAVVITKYNRIHHNIIVIIGEMKKSKIKFNKRKKKKKIVTKQFIWHSWAYVGYNFMLFYILSTWIKKKYLNFFLYSIFIQLLKVSTFFQNSKFLFLIKINEISDRNEFSKFKFYVDNKVNVNKHNSYCGLLWQIFCKKPSFDRLYWTVGKSFLLNWKWYTKYIYIYI